ncbi:MAG: LamG domain-containing protein, partial [Bacteroidales bacterium]|nr:LamG domain-containing protein [Bacteroidales bacterium]
MKKLILSCCLFITACNICVSQDLVAFYPFNNNADDESGNDYHGVVYGATLATDRYGNENSAYSFNGDDYIDIPITGLNQETGSIILWFQISGVDYSYQKVFFSISNNASENITSFYSGIDQRTGLSDSRLLSLVNIEELGSSRWQLWVPESQFNSQTDYNWNHLAVIQDGVETKMYLNGNFVGSFGVSNDLTAWWSDLLSAANPSTVATIGHLRRNGALVDNIGFNGKVDDILIYNRALTEQEILDLYNGTVTVTSPNGGETWTGLSTQDITWNSANTSGNLTIEFSGNNGADWDTIMASTPDVGSFSWTLPEGSYTECLIRISDTDGESEDVSDAVFIIQHSVNPFASNPIVEYRHWGIDQQYELYGLHLRLNVADPQGLENIVSVTVTTPGSIVYNLYDDGQHSDNEASDGYFGYDAWNLNDEPLSGEYVFVVTDAEANNDTVVDILDHTIDIPRNVQPANNSIVTTATPTFSWDEVSGATSYRVNVHDGLTQLWHRDDISTASIQYNNNGTGQPLEEGKIYYWNVNAVIDDAETWHDENRFIYSSNTNNPVVANPQVRSMHRGDDFGNESYGLELYLDVMDPQDLADISSVTVTSPNSDAYTLYDDGQHNDDGANDGRYGNHIWNLNQAPPMGEYLFTATDNSANTDTAIDNLDLVLDYPRNLHPTYNEFITTLHPEFSWDPVAGVTSYWITVRDEFNNEIWSS